MEEEVQQMKLLNTLLENQKEQFCKIVKEAVSKAQEEAFEKRGVLENIFVILLQIPISLMMYRSAFIQPQ